MSSVNALKKLEESCAEYYSSLKGVVKERYDRKISCIRNLDPYKLRTGFTDSPDVDGLPDLTYTKLESYLVYRESFYTGKQFKAFKALLAEDFLASNHLFRFQWRKINSNFVVRGHVSPSMKTTEPARSAWAILCAAGTVLFGHCVCMAGLGETCSHISTLLFAVIHQKEQATSVTDTAAGWVIPKFQEKVEGAPLEDIDFRTPKNILKRKQCASNLPTPQVRVKAAKCPELSDEEYHDLLTTIKNDQERKGRCCAFLVNAPFNEDFKTGVFIPSLKKFYDPKHEELGLEELRELGRNTDISMSSSDIERTFLRTKQQAKNREWYEGKAGKIGGSGLYDILHTNEMEPSISLIRRICYPYENRFSSKQTNYGCNHEKDAIKLYLQNMTGGHENFTYEDSGWIVHPDHFEFGATPDGLVSCECCGEGCVEIKCPFCWKDKTTEDIQGELERNLASQCLEQTLCPETGVLKYSLKKSHKYYYQVQHQIFISGRKYCDFMVWSESTAIPVRVYPDPDFWNEKAAEAKRRFYKILLPEILGRWFTRLDREKKRQENLLLLEGTNVESIPKPDKKKKKNQLRGLNTTAPPGAVSPPRPPLALLPTNVPQQHSQRVSSATPVPPQQRRAAPRMLTSDPIFLHKPSPSNPIRPVILQSTPSQTQGKSTPRILCRRSSLKENGSPSSPLKVVVIQRFSAQPGPTTSKTVTPHTPAATMRAMSDTKTQTVTTPLRSLASPSVSSPVTTRTVTVLQVKHPHQHPRGGTPVKGAARYLPSTAPAPKSPKSKQSFLSRLVSHPS